MSDKYQELIFEQLAEIRASQVVVMFMLTLFLEKNGAEPDTLLTSIEEISRRTAFNYENMMRKAAGLGPRDKPRDPMLANLQEDELNQVDWDKLMEF
ncbi:MAG: hypothetical protein ACK4S4_09380 [Pyrinomonadaceae bacterium]